MLPTTATMAKKEHPTILMIRCLLKCRSRKTKHLNPRDKLLQGLLKSNPLQKAQLEQLEKNFLLPPI